MCGFIFFYLGLEKTSKLGAADSLMTTHFFWFYLALTAARAFYLPGVAPREYKSGEKVELKARPDVFRSIPNRDGEPCLTGLQI